MAHRPYNMYRVRHKLAFFSPDLVSPWAAVSDACACSFGQSGPCQLCVSMRHTLYTFNEAGRSLLRGHCDKAY